MLSENRPVSDLPVEFQKYFWDVAFADLSIKKYPRFIAERILNYGDLAGLKWLLAATDKDFIRSIIKTSRNLNAKTLNYWQLILSQSTD
jgi:hypothetical protein